MMRKTSLKNTTNAREINPSKSLWVLAGNLLNSFSLGVNLSDAEVLVLESFHPFIGSLRLDGLFYDLECLRSFPTTLQAVTLDFGMTNCVAERLPELRLYHTKRQLTAVLGFIYIVSSRRILEVVTIALAAIEAPTRIEQ